ncbi:unnamed protein product [Sphagnum troendelagicum]
MVKYLSFHKSSFALRYFMYHKWQGHNVTHPLFHLPLCTLNEILPSFCRVYKLSATSSSSSSSSSFLDFSGGHWSNVQSDDVLDTVNNIVESKKRRLTFEQVRSLETNFELDNKLEPERKMQLAMELGLQPRQVAVWFQNRRARWKTKQLERDYEVLSLDYSRLKAQFESIVQEKESLKTEVMVLQQLDHEEQSTSCTADQDSCSNSSDILNRDSPGTTTTTKTTIHTSLNMLLTPDQGNSCSPGLHNIFTAPPAAAVDKISTFTVPDPLADHSCNNFFLSQLDVEKATAAAAASGAVCNSMLWWDTWS